MLTNELKAIEVLMRHLVNGTSLRKEAFSQFADLGTFESTKMNLFNIMSINVLLESYDTKPSFSLEYFLFNGIIPGLYDKACAIPTVDRKYFDDINGYFDKLIKALKNGNYVFDENNNVFVSSEEIETTIPAIWLYRLSNAFKKNTYKEMFFFNKNNENNILDVNSLIDYLRHTKTFLVTLSSIDPNVKMDKDFAEAKDRTTEFFSDKKEVKVDDIIEKFKDNVPENNSVVVSKYKLADAFWIINKAQNLEPSFYSKPLEEQKKLINSWMLEFIDSNNLATCQTQKYVLASSLREDAVYRGEDIAKEEVIVGLFNLYISLISELDIDFTNISLSDFFLSNYLSPTLQENLTKLTEIIKLINKEHVLKVDAKAKAATELEKLNTLNGEDNLEKLESRKKKYQKALTLYQEKEENEAQYQITRNQLQAIITEEQKTSLANIAFDNEKIMSLILEATKRGRIYLNQKGSTLYIELYNDKLGKNIFKTSIPLKQLLEFITNLNLILDDVSYMQRIS